MTRVGIVGIGHGVFGRRSDASVQELAFEAYREAVQDAALDPAEIQASVIGAVPEYHKQRSVGGVVQEYLNLNPRPTWLTEVACASGSAAIRTAWMAIRSGMHEVVVVIGPLASGLRATPLEAIRSLPRFNFSSISLNNLTISSR